MLFALKRYTFALFEATMQYALPMNFILRIVEMIMVFELFEQIIFLFPP